MSLWEKWEREKLEQMGIEVERKSDVEIQNMRPKANVRKQTLILAGAFLGCLLVVYFALVMNALYGGYWSNFPLVRAVADRMDYRMSHLDNQ